MIQGLSHITFIVSDLEKMSKLLTHIFDAKEVYSSGEKIFSISKEKFFLIGDLWIAIMEGAALAEKTYSHVAFKIEEKDLNVFAGKIAELDLEMRQERGRVEGEGSSLYFYDYDNHLFELHTGKLEDRLAAYNSLLH